LYLDDGDSLVQEATSEIGFWFNAATKVLEMNGTFGFDAGVKIGNVTVLGEEGPAKFVLDKPLTKGFVVDVETLTVSRFDLQ
jgi:alpha-glucosidase